MRKMYTVVAALFHRQSNERTGADEWSNHCRNCIRHWFLFLVCLCCFCPALAEESIWPEDTVELGGHTVHVHAIIHDTMPDELMQIQLQGRKTSISTFHQALQRHFDLHPDFSQKNVQTVDDYYISEWATGFSNIAAYDNRNVDNREVESIFPVDDPALEALYAQCLSFLQEFEIEATENTGYVCRTQQHSRESITILLPYQIAGLSTEYRNQIVNRDSMQRTDNISKHIMDYPWAAFAFDSDMKLIKVEMSFYEVASSQAIGTQSIPWQQAAETAPNKVVQTRVVLKQQLEGQPDYTEEPFWNEYTVQLSRVLPMWMPNWLNACTPGWCIAYQVYDRSTGALAYALSTCVNAVTGEGAWR